MKRVTIAPRQGWQRIVESQGLFFHTAGGQTYWDERAYYEFTMDEVNTLEQASNSLHAMCLAAAEHVIRRRRYQELHIPEHMAPIIEYSWEQDVPSIYGRFDLSFDGSGPPKMLEYNADTPTSLLEAAVIQWFWLQDRFPQSDQFNSIHERLIAKWTELKRYFHPGVVHFAHMDDLEDTMTVQYLMDTASQAGLEVQQLLVQDIGWEHPTRRFVDGKVEPIRNIFKLYPWEWMSHEQFGKYLGPSREDTFWVEPAWKMILSNKGILPILWELFPDHPNLLPAYFTRPSHLGRYVKKPLLSREGANVTVVDREHTLAETTGDYGEEGHVYQAFAPLPEHSGNYPVLGSWIVDGESAGMGIRESDNLVTTNLSRFIPHRIHL